MRRFLSLALSLLIAAPAALAAELRPASGAAPALALKDLDGREHRLADYRGKVVVINFWATWCEPCREEMPSLQRLADRLAGAPFAVLAVDFGEGPPRIQTFLRQMPVRFPILLDRDTGVAEAWKVKVLPSTWVVGPDQRLRYWAVGALVWDSPAVEAKIRALLPRTSRVAAMQNKMPLRPAATAEGPSAAGGISR